ncbi:hypothetical protein F1880_005763 [Penicillium rolfsii]|nr:hypothetical protein F1880_005763 [Penicillium rolfsii]
MTYREGPEFPFFCHICGAPPTWRGLLADSTLQHLTPEEDDFDHRDYRYPDFLPHQENLGYDARLLLPRHIRWLDAVRLVTKKTVDTVKFTVTEGQVPLLTPLSVYVNIDDGTLHYPEDGNSLCCNVDGYLVHDTCFQMLERVHQHLQATSGSSPHLDLEQLWDWLERGLDDRNNDLVDWGFGDAFQDASTRWPGKRSNPSWQEWIPVKGSMWTVIDPEGPFNCQPLLHRASISTQPGYSFTCSVKLVQASIPALQHPEPHVNVLSLLPRELQLSILELLPTSSVLNLFLASPDFRRHMENLPSSFWKSRLSFDVPWCADIILSQIPIAQGSGTANGRVEFNRLLRFLEQIYASPGREPEGENPEFKGLRNRRRIWMNCKRILKEMEAQSSSGSGHGGQV